MLKRFRMALTTTTGKLKLLIVVSGVALLFMAVTVGALAVTNTPTFCSSCHEMNPEYYTWKGSSHSEVACVKCHIKPGVGNLITHKAESMKQLYYHITGTYITPIEMPKPMESSLCLQCHDMTKRITTPSGDIKFPHVNHLDKNVSCVKCHSGVAHGNIAEKGLTALTDFDSWNEKVGESYVSGPASKYYTKLMMSECLDCHIDKDVSVTCETCHRKIVKPESHVNTTWSSNHGELAAQDIKGCDKCHSITSKYRGTLPLDIDIANYARTNTLCNPCHAKKPVSHTTAWKKTHVTPAAANRTLCLVCHDEAGQNSFNNAPAKTSCQKCHFIRHEVQYSLARHPYKVPASGYGTECARCHAKKACEGCHAKAGT